MTKTNNLLIILGAIAVIGLAAMTWVIYYQDKVLEGLDRETLSLSKQSSSDEAEVIEDDLKETDLTDLDRELTDIERELNSSY